MHHYPYKLRLTTLRNRQIIIKIWKNKDSKGHVHVHSDRKNVIPWQSLLNEKNKNFSVKINLKHIP